MPSSGSPDDYALQLVQELHGLPAMTPEQAAILALLDRIEALEAEVRRLNGGTAGTSPPVAASSPVP